MPRLSGKPGNQWPSGSTPYGSRGVSGGWTPDPAAYGPPLSSLPPLKASPIPFGPPSFQAAEELAAPVAVAIERRIASAGRGEISPPSPSGEWYPYMGTEPGRLPNPGEAGPTYASGRQVAPGAKWYGPIANVGPIEQYGGTHSILSKTMQRTVMAHGMAESAARAGAIAGQAVPLYQRARRAFTGPQPPPKPDPRVFKK